MNRHQQKKAIHINQTIDVNKAPTIWAITLLAAITPAAAVLSPLLVGAYVTSLGFSAQQGGYLIAAELIGAALSTFSTLFIIARFNWHRILYVSISTIVAAYVVSASLTTVELLLPTRFISGLALGTVMTMTIVVTGMTKNQERTFGFWSLGQIVVAVLGFAVLPHVLPVFGLRGFFLAMAVAMALLLYPVRYMPATGLPEHKLGWRGISPKARRLAPLGLLALLLFFTAIGGVWAYVERIAAAADLGAEVIGYVLSVASIVGVVGAGVATWLSTRMGRLLPPLAGYALVGIGILLLISLQNVTFYAVSSQVFKFAWWFTLPYLLANMTLLDPSGRVAILTNFVIAAGMGLGPALAATILEVSQSGGGELNYNAVLFFGLLSLAISFPLLYPVIRANSVAGLKEPGS